jgi:hypothetical protein
MDSPTEKIGAKRTMKGGGRKKISSKTKRCPQEKFWCRKFAKARRQVTKKENCCYGHGEKKSYCCWRSVIVEVRNNSASDECLVLLDSEKKSEACGTREEGENE